MSRQVRKVIFIIVGIIIGVGILIAGILYFSTFQVDVDVRSYPRGQNDAKKPTDVAVAALHYNATS